MIYWAKLGKWFAVIVVSNRQVENAAACVLWGVLVFASVGCTRFTSAVGGWGTPGGTTTGRDGGPAEDGSGLDEGVFGPDAAVAKDGVALDGAVLDGSQDDGTLPDGSQDDGTLPDGRLGDGLSLDGIPSDTVSTLDGPPPRLSFFSLPFDLPAYNGLPGNSVQSVVYAGSRLYVGTTWGLSSSDDGGQRWRQWTARSGLGHPYISHLHYSPEGDLWVSTFSSLYRLVGPAAAALAWAGGTSKGFCSNWIKAAYVMGQDVYVPTLCGFAVSHDGGASFINRNMDQGLPIRGAVGAYADGLKVFVATKAGLGFSVDGGTSFSALTVADGLPSDDVRDVIGRPGGAVFVATKAGLAVGAPGNWAVHRVAQGLPSDDLRRMELNPGRIAVATAGGLAFSDNDGADWVTRTTASGLPSNNLRDVALYGATIAVATDSGVATSGDSGGTWRVTTATSGLATVDASAVTLFGGELLWGTASGLQVSSDDGLSWRMLTTANGLPGNRINDLHVYSGRIYVATDQGLAFGSALDRLTIANAASGLPSRNISGVYVNERAIYLATVGGVAVQAHGGSWVAHSTTSGLATNVVTRIHAAGDTLCVASRSGLGLSFDHGQSWTMRTTADGLRSDRVHDCLIEDLGAGAQAIYAATFNGLYVSKDGAGRSWVSRGSGLRSPFINRVGIFAGALYVATLNGLGISHDDGKTFDFYGVKDGLPYWTVKGFHVTADAVYVATERGVARASRPTL